MLVQGIALILIGINIWYRGFLPKMTLPVVGAFVIVFLFCGSQAFFSSQKLIDKLEPSFCVENKRPSF
jgi:hypothetical protein